MQFTKEVSVGGVTDVRKSFAQSDTSLSPFIPSFGTHDLRLTTILHI
jgi:hypothetical protein